MVEIQVIQDIAKFASTQLGMTRMPDEAYQNVCDLYYDYLSRLQHNSLTVCQARICKAVAAVIKEGMSTCQTWLSSSQCMGHYGKLLRAVRLAQDQLHSLKSLSEEAENKKCVVGDFIEITEGDVFYDAPEKYFTPDQKEDLDNIFLI